MSETSLPRRDVLKGLLATGLAAALPQPAEAAPRAVKPFGVHVFSKHLQFLNFTELAAVASDIGFDGVDLTVRPGGHVEPALAKQMLPRAAEALQQRNLPLLMMTTAITAADHSATRPILETAAQTGVRCYRTGWLPYPPNQPVAATIWNYQQQLTELARLNEAYGLAGAYQNHAGTNFGAAVWDLAQVLTAIKSPNMGVQYDIRHATVEGGMSWSNGLKLIMPHIRFLAIKDFVWEKRDGKWQVVNVPLGEGMVDFKSFFALLKAANFHAPISLHLEYPLGGAEHGNKTLTIPKEKVYEAMRRDLETLRKMLPVS
ncbi:sugar phosphate isomerase/epimerase family protein [Tellurirhabdus rosea]|uniref:sugar phosphate isomerase/epimerase family protein n=1 Tax=Tellurirhabdus rosea TaxID=2674997 RepID=UPI00225669A4|nr:sugar phosphate isomerase/epimerase family protein [Tellurirhabdus rosea]